MELRVLESITAINNNLMQLKPNLTTKKISYLSSRQWQQNVRICLECLILYGVLQCGLVHILGGAFTSSLCVNALYLLSLPSRCQVVNPFTLDQKTFVTV